MVLIDDWLGWDACCVVYLRGAYLSAPLTSFGFEGGDGGTYCTGPSSPVQMVLMLSDNLHRYSYYLYPEYVKTTHQPAEGLGYLYSGQLDGSHAELID
jgi:hypothetical protein